MSTWAFRFLLWYVCILYTAPQNRFQFLIPFHIADIAVGGAVALHFMSAGQGGGQLLRLGPASKLSLLLIILGLLSQYAGPLVTDTSWNGFIDILIKSSIVALLIEGTCVTVKRVWIVQATLLLATLWWVKGGIRLSGAGATFSGDRLMGPAVGMVENPNGFAYMMSLILPTYLYFFQQAAKAWLRYASLVLSVIAVYIILQTGSRTGMLCLITVGVFLLPKYGARHKKVLVVVGAAIFVLSSSIGALNVERFKSIPRSITRFLTSVEDTHVELLDVDAQSANERKMKNRDTWALIKAYPLFGVGMHPDESKFADTFPYATGQVHCEILAAGREMGFIGMGLHLAFLGTLFLLGLRSQHYFKGWWPAASDLGWTFKMQALVMLVGGSFAPIPWNPPMMILCASCSALWGLRSDHPRPAP